MDFKNLKLREWLVIIFIALGLLAFVFEKQFSPTVYKVSGTGEGFNGEISLEIKAYKKKNGEIRIIEIKAEHNDTPAIANPAISKLIENAMHTQKNNIEGVAGATYTSQGCHEALKDAIDKLNNL